MTSDKVFYASFGMYLFEVFRHSFQNTRVTGNFNPDIEKTGFIN